MATIFPFAPQPNGPFQFAPVLDAQSCTAIVTWSLFGQRWYMNLYSSDNTLVVSRAVVGSDIAHNIQSMEWSHGRVSVVTTLPHDYDPLDTVDLLFSGSLPDAFNGLRRCFVTGPANLSFPLAVDPGSLLSPGQATYPINLVDGYFASIMIFREANQQFEVTP